MPEELSDRPAGRCGPDPAQYAGHRPAAGPEAVLVGFGGPGVVVMVGSGPELWDTIVAELDRSGADLPDLLTLGGFDADRAALSSMPPPRSPATSRSPHPTATPTEVHLRPLLAELLTDPDPAIGVDSLGIRRCLIVLAAAAHRHHAAASTNGSTLHLAA